MSTPLPPRGRRRLTRLALLAPALGAAAFALALAVTDPPGPGLDPDAMAYLGAAVSLARAGSYDVPAAVIWPIEGAHAPYARWVGEQVRQR